MNQDKLKNLIRYEFDDYLQEKEEKQIEESMLFKKRLIYLLLLGIFYFVGMAIGMGMSQ